MAWRSNLRLEYYYIKVLLGFIMGAVCGILKLKGLVGILLGVGTLAILILYLKKMGVESRKLFEGVMEYVGAWATLWSLLYSIL
ncbi:MAG: Rab5-interacting family protein [Thermoproteales archaeon]|nr:Rab5-interacting family protein [Thermoproteales archaeon]